MNSPLYAISAIDKNGNIWYAVNEPLFGGWCAMTPDDVIIRARMARNFGESPPDVYDVHRFGEAVASITDVRRSLPAFRWDIKLFARKL